MMMLATFAAVLALQVGVQPAPTPPGDTSKTRSISIGVGRERLARKVIPLTPALEASAFRDPAARAVVTRARSARAVQDSQLQSYEATSNRRVSVGARLKAIGRERLIYRVESARRIQWQRGVGAHVEVIGGREVSPVVSSNVSPVDAFSSGPSTLPYYPGREALWPMGEIGGVVTDSGFWVHPLIAGAEAYYRYATGDSIAFRLANGETIRLREIRLTPREPRWDLIVGSFWFDEASGQLVRAIYRPSVPMDLQMNMSVNDREKSDFSWLQPLVFTVKSVSVEFSLQEGRWWLPIRQAAEGEAQVLFAHIPSVIELKYSYSLVNAVPPLAPIVIDSLRDSSDTSVGANLSGASQAQRDSLARLAEALRRPGTDEQRNAIREARRTLLASIRAEQCAANGGFRRATGRNDSVLVSVTIPCDSAVLVNSPALPASIFDEADDPLTQNDVEMLARALGMGSQATWSPTPPTLRYGINLLRYNRVEGLSVGAEVQQQFGAGFSGSLIGRIGVADLHPRAELMLSRSDAWRTIGVGAYERLGVANDWGTPLDFGASLNALLFGRDEGLYYRATGVEISGSGLEGSTFSWRLFGEQNRPAPVETQFSLPHVLNGFRFRENIVADRADLLGAAARFQRSYGLDPEGFRALGDLRLEGATGDFDFARAMLDLTLSRGLGGPFQGSVTGAGGSSRGIVPVQRLWYLGGVHTIRGQPFAAASGDAFWMGRGELGYSAPVVRPSVFYDLGWAGDRRDWRTPGRPLSGAGVGLSVLDGLLRLDVAKGIRPSRGVRVDLTLEARF
jgi:hypothetical protein